MTTAPVWIDSHCHLEMLKGDLQATLLQSAQNAMDFCITIGTDHASNQHIAQLSRTHTNVYGTLGIHPHEASGIKPAHLDWIRDQVKINRKIIGIGECGYDLFYNHSETSAQTEAFIQQLDLAVELKMPVVIHTREAESETRKVLENYKAGDITGVFHCFTSSLDLAKFALDRGFYLSFNGICTFPKSEDVREILKYTPLDRILLETDSPYLAPVPHRGKPNIPGYVSIIGEYIAEFLGISGAELAEITAQNTYHLFPRIAHES